MPTVKRAMYAISPIKTTRREEVEEDALLLVSMEVGKGLKEMML
jgi:hypothetical protein